MDLLTITDQIDTILQLEDLIFINPLEKNKEHKTIELKLSMDFDSFDEKKKQEILIAISRLLNIDDKQVILRDIKRGSVILSLELPNEDEAEKLFLLIKIGELKEKGVSNVRLKSLINSLDNDVQISNDYDEIQKIFKRSKESIKNGKIEQALDYLDTFLEKRHEDYHRQIILYLAPPSFQHQRA